MSANHCATESTNAMTGSVNKVILVGNLTADPDVKMIENRQLVGNFNLATSDQWKDKNTGERRERAEYHRVVIWNAGLVGIVEQYLLKGSKVYIEGQLRTRKWQDQSGQTRYSTEIVLQGFDSKLVMLGGPSTNKRNISSGFKKRKLPVSQNKPDYSAGMDDEIPF